MGLSIPQAGIPAQHIVAPTDPYVYRIRDIVCRIAGIFHPDNKLYFVADRVARRMRALKIHDTREYLDRLTIRSSSLPLDRQQKAIYLPLPKQVAGRWN